jgi:hypothetical protein
MASAIYGDIAATPNSQPHKVGNTRKSMQTNVQRTHVLYEAYRAAGTTFPPEAPTKATRQLSSLKHSPQTLKITIVYLRGTPTVEIIIPGSTVVMAMNLALTSGAAATL